MEGAINAANLDLSKVDWQQPYNLDHLRLSRLDMEHAAKAADALFKFAKSEKTALHGDVEAFLTFALQGPHRIYSSLGDLEEGRSMGTNKMGPAGRWARCRGPG